MNANDFEATISVTIPDDPKCEEYCDAMRQLRRSHDAWRKRNGFTQRAEIYTLDKSGRILHKHVL